MSVGSLSGQSYGSGETKPSIQAGAKTTREEAIENFFSSNKNAMRGHYDQYKDDIKRGDFLQVSQNASEFYQVLLEAGIAPKEGLVYNNFIIIKSNFMINQEPATSKLFKQKGASEIPDTGSIFKINT